MSMAEHLDTLVEIARSVGVTRVDVGTKRPPFEVIIGDPPAGAMLFRDGGATVLRCAELNTAHDIEAALHELAHVQHGYRGADAEERCYETAAVWALRFPPKVSAEVNRMRGEAMS